MNKVEEVRALFREGEEIECVENTYIPTQDGTRRRITKVGKSFADCELASTGDGKDRTFYMALPTRVRDVLAVDSSEATYYLDQSLDRLRGHTVTIRRVSPGKVESAEGQSQSELAK